MNKKESRINLNDNEIIFFNNETTTHITTYMMNYLKCIHKRKKILYFTSLYKEKDLLEKYKILDKKNILIVDKTFSITLENIEQYIIKSTDYVFIDQFKVTYKNNQPYIEDNTFKYVIDRVEELSKQYGCNFIIAINKENKKKGK